MYKFIYSFFGVLVITIIASTAIILNPYDKQYQSYYLEQQAFKALDSGNADKYFKYMDNPVTVKYHFSGNYTLAINYIIAGRYDDAQRVINSYKKEYNYGFCAESTKSLSKFLCRLDYSFENTFMKNQPQYSKNYYLSKLYFAKGDYKKAVEYNKKSEVQDGCFSSMIYGAVGDKKAASDNLLLCKIQQKNKKYPRKLYLASGYFYLKQKQYDKALIEFQKDLNTTQCGNGKYRKCRGNNTTYFYMAQCFEESGSKEKAKSYYKKILFNEPWNFKAKKGLETLKK